MSESLLTRYDALLVDLDGTIYRGTEVIPPAPDAIAHARSAEVPVRFVTNNASRTPQTVSATLGKLGVAVEPDDVDTSAQAGADLAAAYSGDSDAVLVVGADALLNEVARRERATTRCHDRDVAAVVQGFSEDVGWRQLAEACTAIRAGASWVACNVDPTLPTERGLLPGNGSLVAALRAATGAAPTVAGKPGEALMRRAIEKAAARRPLVIGDRLETDIAGAAAVGADSVLVLSGVASGADLLGAVGGQRPRYVLEDLGGLTEPLADIEIGSSGEWQVERQGKELRVTHRGRTARPVALLRTLCAAAWGDPEPPDAWSFAPADEPSSAALAELALA
jgi:HAD superfamily hydrolase (TIGR01450 family)